MIPTPVVEPFAPRAVARAPRRTGYLVGALLCGLAVLGGLLWLQGTPFSFSRFSIREGDLVTDLQPGTYLVFEERSGVTEPALPPPLTVAVSGRDGTVVDVEMLVPPNTETSPHTYRTVWHEGRAIARFTITEDGPYHIRTVPIRRGGGLGYGPRLGGTLAVGRDTATTWLASPLGAVVLAGVPLLLGAIVLLVAASRARRARRQRTAPPERSSSLTAHG